MEHEDVMEDASVKNVINLLLHIVCTWSLSSDLEEDIGVGEKLKKRDLNILTFCYFGFWMCMHFVLYIFGNVILLTGCHLGNFFLLFV